MSQSSLSLPLEIISKAAYTTAIPSVGSEDTVLVLGIVTTAPSEALVMSSQRAVTFLSENQNPQNPNPDVIILHPHKSSSSNLQSSSAFADVEMASPVQHILTTASNLPSVTPPQFNPPTLVERLRLSVD